MRQTTYFFLLAAAVCLTTGGVLVVLVLPNEVGRDEVDATGAGAVTDVLAFCCLSLDCQLALASKTYELSSNVDQFVVSIVPF